jgi:hypothetical protein
MAFAAPLLSTLPAFVICECCTGCMLKHFSDAFASFGTALNVFDGADALPDFLTLVIR